MKPPFKIGDRVICISQFDDNDEIIGMTGTICGPMNSGWCGVEYDFQLTGGHDCYGNCDAPFGWCTSYDCLKLYEESEPVASEISYEELGI